MFQYVAYTCTGADPLGGGPPPKIGKNMIFWRKIVIFHTQYPKKFRTSLRSARLFYLHPLTWNPGSAPAVDNLLLKTNIRCQKYVNDSAPGLVQRQRVLSGIINRTRYWPVKRNFSKERKIKAIIFLLQHYFWYLDLNFVDWRWNISQHKMRKLKINVYLYYLLIVIKHEHITNYGILSILMSIFVYAIY